MTVLVAHVFEPSTVERLGWWGWCWGQSSWIGAGLDRKVFGQIWYRMPTTQSDSSGVPKPNDLDYWKKCFQRVAEVVKNEEKRRNVLERL